MILQSGQIRRRLSFRMSLAATASAADGPMYNCTAVTPIWIQRLLPLGQIDAAGGVKRYPKLSFV
jgi:hypothetical protein